MEASLLLPQKRRPMSPFGGGLFDDSSFNDPFFDSFFGGAQRKPIEVTSPEVLFNVIALPVANQPKDFGGAIGDFTLKVVANRHDLEVGEPLKLSIEIAGTGNFDRVEAPSFPENADWKTYTPSATFTSHGNSYSGVKIFDQAVVAKNDAVKEIPPLSFSYFDPVKKDYITVTSAPIAIKLARSAVPPPPPSPSVPQNSPIAPKNQDTQAKPSNGLALMAPLDLQMGAFSKEIIPIFLRSWFLAIAILCLVVLVALFALKWRRQNLARHPEKELRRRKDHLLAHHLNLVEKACNSGNSTEFLASARTAIQNQVGLSWNLQPTAISLASLKERLGPESPLVEIFTAADSASYGGATLSREKMESYLRTMKKALEELR
jgi:hypothetical protein